MVCRPAGNNIDFIERVEIRCIPCEFFKRDALLIACNALAHRIANSLRLFVNLLEHEVLIAALLRSLCIPCNLKYLLRYGLSRTIFHLDAVLAHQSKLSITEDISTARARNNRRNVGGNEVLPLAQTDDERVVLLRADEDIRMLPAHECKCI